MGEKECMEQYWLQEERFPPEITVPPTEDELEKLKIIGKDEIDKKY